MIMELPDAQDFELTLEDILNLHQQWITKLYMDDRKPVEEIVESLRVRGLFVTYESNAALYFFFVKGTDVT